MKGHGISKRKQKALRSLMKSERKLQLLRTYIETLCPSPTRSESLSHPKISASTDDSGENDDVCIVGENDDVYIVDENDDVCIVGENFKHANVANSSLREIYARNASGTSVKNESSVLSKDDIPDSLQSVSQCSISCSHASPQSAATKANSQDGVHNVSTLDAKSSSVVVKTEAETVSSEVGMCDVDGAPYERPSLGPTPKLDEYKKRKYADGKHVTSKKHIPEGHYDCAKRKYADLPPEKPEVLPTVDSPQPRSASASSKHCDSPLEPGRMVKPASPSSSTSKDSSAPSTFNNSFNNFILERKIAEFFCSLREHCKDGKTEEGSDIQKDPSTPLDMKQITTPARELSTSLGPGKMATPSLPISSPSKDSSVLSTPAVQQTDVLKPKGIDPDNKKKNQPGNSKQNSVQNTEKSSLSPEKKEKNSSVSLQSVIGNEGSMKEINMEKSSITFSDVAGLEKTLKKISLSLFHLKRPDIYEKIGLRNPPRGILLHGPPGCGKTLIANAIAGELQLPLIKMAATEFVCGIVGDSEKKIRELFEKATLSAPCILFIDEIDAIGSKRRSFRHNDVEKRMVIQLMKCMDDLNLSNLSSQVMVIGATNKPDDLDSSLRRAGRFNCEIAIGVPDEASRLEIFKHACKNLRLEPSIDLHQLARMTPGYVGADITAVITEAAMLAINRVFESSDGQVSSEGSVGDNRVSDILRLMKESPSEGTSWNELSITVRDFEEAIRDFVPSTKREGFATIPNVTWDDVGALTSVKEALQRAILWPLKYQKEIKEFNLTVPSGVLLCGPKGCGKTLIAKAVANECNINFLSVKGPELLNMYVGESERAVRECFQRARDSAPCVIFFDEIDALCPQRSKGPTDFRTADRVVNQILTEMDGIGERKQIFVMGATNRPDSIDSAMLRPGRLEKQIFVGIPTQSDRLEILKTITKNGVRPKLGEDISLEELSSDARSESFSGADLRCLVQEASFKALEGYINSQKCGESCDFAICRSHFDYAFSVVKPSISDKDKQFFKNVF